MGSRLAGPALLVALASASAPSSHAGAQVPTVPYGTSAASLPLPIDTAATHAALRRARQLVNEGQGAQGRAVVESLLVTIPPAAGLYADVLFARATLAASAEDAERDYRRLNIEFTSSPRAEDALMRLAQLEIARGNPEAAIRELDRLVMEHPRGAGRARAGYWLARVHFDRADKPAACSAIRGGQAALSPADTETRAGLESLSRRCIGVTSDTMAAGRLSRETAPKTEVPLPRPAAPVGGYSVQVAAFDAPEPARNLVARLKARGHDARVDGTARLG